MPLFKNIVVHRIAPDWSPPSFDSREAELQRLAFQHCGPTQELSLAWVQPQQGSGAMVESVDGQ